MIKGSISGFLDEDSKVQRGLTQLVNGEAGPKLMTVYSFTVR